MNIKDLKAWHFLLIAIITPIVNISVTYGIVTVRLDQVRETKKELSATKERVYNLEAEFAKTSTSSQKDIDHLQEFKDEIKEELKYFKEEVKTEMKETRTAIEKLTESINRSPYLIGYGE